MGRAAFRNLGLTLTCSGRRLHDFLNLEKAAKANIQRGPTCKTADWVKLFDFEEGAKATLGLGDQADKLDQAHRQIDLAQPVIDPRDISLHPTEHWGHSRRRWSLSRQDDQMLMIGPPDVAAAETSLFNETQDNGIVSWMIHD